MDNMNHTPAEEYTSPAIVDHGTLAELTAGLGTGSQLDATFPAKTPKTQLTFSGPTP